MKSHRSLEELLSPPAPQRLNHWRNRDAIAQRIAAAGLEPEHGKFLARCVAALIDLGVSDHHPAYILHVPGRIEVLGKHTDYCGGRSLLCDTSRGFCFVAAPNNSSEIRLISTATGEKAHFPLSPAATAPQGTWAAYAAAVARRLSLNFGHLTGLDIAFESNLPPAAGLSSSSALITGLALLILVSSSAGQHPALLANIQRTEDLAHYCGCCENGSPFGTLAGEAGVGTSGGSQDHTAILLSEPNRLVRYSFAPVAYENHVDLPVLSTPEGPKNLVFAILHSGIIAEKTADAMPKYNRLSAGARDLVALWNKTTSQNEKTPAAIVHSSPDAANVLRRALRDHPDRQWLSERLAQFLEESDSLIPAAFEALANNRLDLFGQRVDESQRNAEKLLGNQIPATIALCKAARQAGALAASAFGAGFGGSVWALIPADQSESFINRVATPAGKALSFSTPAAAPLTWI